MQSSRHAVGIRVADSDHFGGFGTDSSEVKLSDGGQRWPR